MLGALVRVASLEACCADSVVVTGGHTVYDTEKRTNAMKPVVMLVMFLGFVFCFYIWMLTLFSSGNVDLVSISTVGMLTSYLFIGDVDIVSFQWGC